uniref:L2 linker protein of V1 giant hemoglobin n=1 Tax=Lamellibrachia satsuma TaxID=104711 RepID=A0A125SXX7_LAMSA|nr:L2 linker protein of V1 giant hemoglobin [Lamellibrachia satsuma]
MKTVLLVCALVAYAAAAAIQPLSVSDSMAARVDAQAWRVDRLTKQFQEISDAADSSIAAAKSGGDIARHMLNNHLDDHWCPSKYQRCGNSPQCMSNMAFCDGINDCKNHFDEDEHRCVVPVTANSTWIGYPAYDHCTQRRPYEMVISITSAASDIVYKVHQPLKVQVDLFSKRGGLKQSASLRGDAVYCKGSQRLIIPPPEDDRLEIIGQFDGVFYDRFKGYIVHEMSGDKCAEFRFFKQ